MSTAIANVVSQKTKAKVDKEITLAVVTATTTLESTMVSDVSSVSLFKNVSGYPGFGSHSVL